MPASTIGSLEKLFLVTRLCNLENIHFRKLLHNRIKKKLVLIFEDKGGLSDKRKSKRAYFFSSQTFYTASLLVHWAINNDSLRVNVMSLKREQSARYASSVFTCKQNKFHDWRFYWCHPPTGHALLSWLKPPRHNCAPFFIIIGNS